MRGIDELIDFTREDFKLLTIEQLNQLIICSSNELASRALEGLKEIDKRKGNV